MLLEDTYLNKVIFEDTGLVQALNMEEILKIF